MPLQHYVEKPLERTRNMFVPGGSSSKYIRLSHKCPSRY